MTGIFAAKETEIGRLGSSENRLAVKPFSQGVVSVPQSEWPCVLAMAEAERTEDYAALGIPGCIGDVDYAGWKWEMGPMAWQGPCTSRKNAKPVARL